jgi:hypothetical protein
MVIGTPTTIQLGAFAKLAQLAVKVVELAEIESVHPIDDPPNTIGPAAKGVASALDAPPCVPNTRPAKADAPLPPVPLDTSVDASGSIRRSWTEAF